MEKGLIFIKTSTCKQGEVDYLDEKSNLKIEMDVHFKNISHDEAVKARDELVKSVEYLTKEECGKVFAGGFLRDKLLSEGGIAPENLENEKRKRLIESALKKHTADFGLYRGTSAHKLVFSMDAELKVAITKNGLDPDKILADRMKKVLKKFESEFHPGDRIGYAFGVHHDTDNLHIHVLLSNRTEKGRHVAVSCPEKGKHDKRARKDQIGFIRKELEKAEQQLLKKLEKNEVNKLGIGDHSVKRAEIEPPENLVDGKDDIHPLHVQYNQLILMQAELERRRGEEGATSKLKTLDSVKADEFADKIRKRISLIEMFRDLKDKYLYNLNEHIARDESAKKAPSVTAASKEQQQLSTNANKSRKTLDKGFVPGMTESTGNKPPEGKSEASEWPAGQPAFQARAARYRNEFKKKRPLLIKGAGAKKVFKVKVFRSAVWSNSYKSNVARSFHDFITKREEGNDCSIRI